jgi:hypothetical protein
MKINKLLLVLALLLPVKIMFGQHSGKGFDLPALDWSQRVDPFMERYMFHKLAHGSSADNYLGIDGNPYQNKDFVEGIIALKDSSALKLPLRYNIYSDTMEFKVKDQVYSIGNTAKLSQIIIGESKFVYLSFIKKGGYFEFFEPGKCLLAQKRSVKFYPAEEAKPLEGIAKPPRFVNENDVFYIVFSQSKFYKINNTKSLLEALKDQKQKIESYMDQENIKNTKKENLIKIVKYYNTL